MHIIIVLLLILKSQDLCLNFLPFGCCGFFGLFGHVLKVVLSKVSLVSVAGVFRGQKSELCLCSVLSPFLRRCWPQKLAKRYEKQPLEHGQRARKTHNHQILAVKTFENTFLLFIYIYQINPFSCS